MNEKRNILIWINDKLIKNKFCNFVNFLMILLIWIASGIVYYNNHIEEIPESYSEEAYEYLEEVVRKVIYYDIGIDDAAIPEDITEYDIHYKNDEIIFSCYLNNNEGKEYTTSASITIKLSKDFEILNEKRNFSSRDEYINFNKSYLKMQSTTFGGTVTMIVLFIEFIVIIAVRYAIYKKSEIQNEK